MYRPNIYNMSHRNNATFQSNFRSHFVPPPPVPPPFFIPPPCSIETLDLEFIKTFDTHIPARQKPSIQHSLSISDVHEELRKIIVALDDLRRKEKILKENISTLSEEEWNMHLNEIEEIKLHIKKTLSHVNSPFLDVLRKRLAKRAAKRLRMKRVRKENQREKEEKRKELQERSRKIDENLQKIKDDIIKVQKEQEAKLEADVVLKEVLHKKHDAKKCIMKLEALVKLRKARQNTAKGRGESVSDSASTTFHSTIDKLKLLWTRKLSNYEKEEADLRVKLKVDSEQIGTNTNATEREVVNNLDKWIDVMFGGQLPQVDFRGDVGRFLTVRSQWDQYISTEGTTLPIGWVPPNILH